MIKFYYHPLSPIARRVWLALIEKKIPFEPIIVNLPRGEQRKANYLAINPFHHVPAIVDGNVRIIESLAILDYLEAEYPNPSFMPRSSVEIAQMRMLQMIMVNEAIPLIPIIVTQGIESEIVQEKLATILSFLADKLGDNLYFGGEGLNLADLVAGATIPLLCRLGMSLYNYPNLSKWCQNLIHREAWQQTDPSEDGFKQWQRYIEFIIKNKAS